MPIPLSLFDKINQLSEPTDFLIGLQPATSPSVPQNVLCFYRTSGEQLDPPSRAQYHHYRYVIILNIEGIGKVFLDDDVVHFRPGEALLIRPFQFHHFDVPRRSRVCWLFITFELETPFECQFFVSQVASDERTMSLVECFLNAYLDGRAERASEPEVAVLFLGAILIRLFRRTHPETVQPSIHSNQPLFSSIRKKLQANPSLKVGELCRALGATESTMRRRFRKACGVHLGVYLVELRFHFALDDIRSRDFNLTEIAFRTGYESLQAFSRAFKTRTGMSPREYRKRAIR